SARVRYASGPTSRGQCPSWVRARIPSQVLPPVLPVRNRGGGPDRRVRGAVLPDRLLPAAVLRSVCLQRTCDIQPAGELRAAARDGPGRAAASLAAAVPDRGRVRKRALRAAGRRGLDAVSVGLDPESPDVTAGAREPAGHERAEQRQRPRSNARRSALSLDR